ncbi:MAG TPA: hypothetical protein VF575_02680 [Candidatus Saccharimonadales bacterium]|jgi:hypothetical protein
MAKEDLGRLEREYTLAKDRHERLETAAENIRRIFAGEGQIPVTQSAEGNNRVRAFIPDEDGYAGWTEHNKFLGLVEIAGSEPQKYQAEQHYPNLSDLGNPTYTWDFKPDNHELTVSIVQTVNNNPPLDIGIPADDKQVELFLGSTRQLLRARPYNDYEFRRLGADEHAFEHPDLK